MHKTLVLEIFRQLLMSENISRKKRLIRERERIDVERKIQRNQSIAVWMLSQRKRQRVRSCWVRPELLDPNHGNFWEVTVPLYSGKDSCYRLLSCADSY